MKSQSKKHPTLKDRRSGLLLHLSSLPGPYYCGDLGKAAYRFADFLAAAGQSWWQMLPVNPIGLGNSPYSTTSSFAGDPLYIDLEGLVNDGLLKRSEIARPQALSPDRVYYQKARRYREARLKKAYSRFMAVKENEKSARFARFLAQHEYWLEDFALFCVLAKKFKTPDWRNWPPDLRRRKPSALSGLQAAYRPELDYIKFLQFKPFSQWSLLKTYLRKRGVGLIGDLSIFVGYQSSDVWAWPKYFQLKHDGSKKYVAGVPPDYYCPEGQLWGNPLYNWPALKKDGFKWWIQRVKHITNLFDVVRLDHFIGFYRHWEIKAGSNTARDGRFRKTPGRDLFLALKSELGDLPFIAEDLGTVVPGVYALRDEFGLPGMRVLQFGFGNEKSAQYHLPFNYSPNSVVYTGTHDSNTLAGWYDEAQTKAKQNMINLEFFHHYMGGSRKNMHWVVIREAMQSVANLAIFPVQDVLGLNSKARMNIPGKASGNWQWHLAKNALSKKLAAKLNHVTRTFHRDQKNRPARHFSYF